MSESLTFLNREEAAQSLRVSVSTLDRWIKSGDLRVARIGRRIVISDQAIEDLYRKAEAAS